MNNSKKAGAKLAALRSKCGPGRKGLTQSQLALHSGVSRSTIARLESGYYESAVQLDTLEYLANALDVRLSALLR